MKTKPGQEQGASENKPARGASTQLSPHMPDTGFRRAFAALRQRNYRLYWFGQLISQLGTNMQIIGEAWLVLQLTHSAWQLGLVGALQFLPVLLFALIGGVFADRWPKRRVLLFTQTAALVQASLLYALIATGTIQIWHLYILALLLGITNSLDQPTRSAFVVEMVGRADLPNAVALNSSLLNLVRIVGPGLGGIVIAASGVALLFLLNTLSFIAVLVGLALINQRALHVQALSTTHQSTWQSLREGLGYVWKTPAVAWVIVTVGLVLLFGANFNVFLPLFATDVLHVGATGFGFLSAAIGVGALLATLWLASNNQSPTIRHVLIGTLVFGILEVLFAISRSYLLSFVFIACIGATEAVFGALALTMIQTLAPDHLRGRVISVEVFFFTGSAPPGFLLAGWLSGFYGASTAMLICALLTLVVVGFGWLWRKSAEQSIASLRLLETQGG